MRKARFFFDSIRLLSCLTLLILVSGCNFPGGEPTATSTPEANAVLTQAANTALARLASPTPQPATLTPLPTLEIPTPEPVTPSPSASPIPVTPTIKASVDTNCRLGPDTNYSIVGYLLVGQQSTVHGRNAANTWWYIENPTARGSYCWVWGQNTQVQGDILTLEVIKPPTAPTAPPGSNVAVSFSNIHNCNGVPTAIFQVRNEGFDTLKSVSLSIVDLTSGNTLFGPVNKNAPFQYDAGECPWGGNNLKAGETGFIGGSLGPNAKSKHQGIASITICTEKGLVGDCDSFRVQFKIP